MMAFRHADGRFPFLWEGAGQPAARWNAMGDEPVQYFADTPDGAWAEFLRHEEITAAEDLATIRRVLWVVELEERSCAEPRLPESVLTGGTDSYEACRAEAGRLRAQGGQGLRAPSAALRAGAAGGWRVNGGLQPGPVREGRTIGLFGARPDLVGWRAAEGHPHDDLLAKVRPLAGSGSADPGFDQSAGAAVKGSGYSRGSSAWTSLT